MQHLDEGTIHAWIDGALSADEASRVDAHVASCVECAAKVAEARGLVAASSRIVSALDVTPGGVLPAFGAKKARRWWSVGTSVGATLAASLVIAVGYGVIRREPATPTESAALVADSFAPRAIATSTVLAPKAPPARAKTQRLLADRGASAKSTSGATDVHQALPAAAPMAASIDSSKLTIAQVVPDSARVTAMRRQVAITNDSLRPIPAPSAEPRIQVSRAAMSAGAGAGRASAQAQPAPSAVTAFTPNSGLAGRATFVGCYETNQSTDVLPKRFALRADSVGGNEVRYVDSAGTINGHIADADWIDAQGRAIIRSTGRGPILTIVRTSVSLIAQSSLGPRTVRVVPCK